MRIGGSIWKPLLAILVVQLGFWLVYYPFIVKRPALPPVIAEAQAISEGAVPKPTYAAVKATQLKPLEELPFSVCCEPGYRALKFTLDLPKVPDRGLVMLPGFGADNHFVYVNGQFADGRGRLGLPRPTYHHNDFRMIRIMPGSLHAGPNEFVVILTRSTGTGFDYHPVMVFDARDYKAPHERREFIIGTFAWMQLAVAILITLFALLLVLRSSDRAMPCWLFALAGCWTLNLLFFKWVDPPFGGYFRLGYSHSSFLLMAASCFGLAYSWSGPRPRWLAAAGILVTVVTLGLIWQTMYFAPEALRFERGNFYAAIGGLLLSATATLLLLRDALRLDSKRMWEFAFALPLPAGLSVDLYGELVDQVRLGLSELSQPILITGLLAAFFARNIHLFRSQEQISLLLQGQLDQRTAELEAAHAREKELVRTQAHQHERQRIMRDMHDGLGSQLMSMLLAARRGVAKPAAVAEGLQSVVDEMRLMIDSMDSVGESLGSAFAIFRDRVAPRVGAAGLSFVWDEQWQGKLPDYGPRDVLQIFRIMQEGVTNALKHSGAKMLAVRIVPSPDPAFALRIAIADDGAGLGKANPRGKGMTSMESRAAGIGAKLGVESSKNGVTLNLDLPAKSAVI